MSDNLNSARAGLLTLYGTIILLALNGVYAKLIPLDATSVTQVRSVVASLALFGVLALQKSTLRLDSIVSFCGVYGLGVLLGLHWITYFHSMKISSVAIGMLSLFSYPVVTVVVEPLFKGLLPNKKDLAAAVIVFLGIFLMVSPELLAGNYSTGAVHGAFWGIVSAFIFSIRNIFQKYSFYKIKSTSLMAHQTLAIAVLLVPFITPEEIVSLSFQSWLLIITLGLLSTAMAHTLLSMSLKRLPAKSVALISCFVPVAGSFLAWLVLAEVPGIMVYVGGSIILSVAIYESLKYTKKYDTKK